VVERPLYIPSVTAKQGHVEPFVCTEQGVKMTRHRNVDKLVVSV
jgi:hypothetical protein